MDQVKLHHSLKRFQTTDLETIGQDHLMDRHDLKYVLPVEKTVSFLNGLSPDWQILQINKQVLHHYENLYFDTDNFQCYLDHHNERRSRYKFRIRTYQQTGESFLEVKEKTNKEKTLKTRLTRPTRHPHLTKVEQDWLRQLQKRINPALLLPQLQTQYRRISLIHSNGDRLTIDQSLIFKTADRTLAFQLPHLTIVELKKCHKHHTRSNSLPFWQQELSPLPISKYCLGILLTSPEIKHNRFKEKWRPIKEFLPFWGRSKS